VGLDDVLGAAVADVDTERAPTVDDLVAFLEDRETNGDDGEILTAVRVPARDWARRSTE